MSSYAHLPWATYPKICDVRVEQRLGGRLHVPSMPEVPAQTPKQPAMGRPGSPRMICTEGALQPTEEELTAAPGHLRGSTDRWVLAGRTGSWVSRDLPEPGPKPTLEECSLGQQTGCGVTLLPFALCKSPGPTPRPG